MLITITTKNIRANFLLLVLALLVASTILNDSVMAQSEQGRLVGIINYEKALPKNNNDLEAEFFATLYQENLGDTKKENKKVNQATIVEKSMTDDFGAFMVDLIQSSSPSVNWKNTSTIKCTDENIKSILCKEYVPLMSWMESERSFVKIYSDLNQSKSTAVLYEIDDSKKPNAALFEINK
jgi:hypothetical protein